MSNVQWSRPLSSIPWSTLATGSGFATHVPAAIELLSSDDEEARKSAYWQLDNNIVLQSDLYEPAYYVVPFLIDILRSGPPSARPMVYKLMFEIANGGAIESTLVKSSLNEYVSLRTGCQDAIAEGMNLYFNDVHSDDRATSEGALEVLSVLDSQRDVIKARLIAEAEMTSDEQLKSSLLLIVNELEEDG